MTSTPHFQGQSTLGELFTIVYVMVDDYLKASERAGHFKLPQAANQKGSYAELMTIALVGELRSQSHVGNWFDFIKLAGGSGSERPRQGRRGDVDHPDLRDQHRLCRQAAARQAALGAFRARAHHLLAEAAHEPTALVRKGLAPRASRSVTVG